MHVLALEEEKQKSFGPMDVGTTKKMVAEIMKRNQRGIACEMNFLRITMNTGKVPIATINVSVNFLLIQRKQKGGFHSYSV